MTRWLLVRAIITGLSFLTINTAMAAAPGQAFYNWYLYYSPVMIAALSFGIRGAIAASTWAAVSLWMNFNQAGQPGELMGGLANPIVLTEEASRLVGGLSSRLFVHLADGSLIGAATYKDLLNNAVLGVVLTTGVSCVIGWLVDENHRQTAQFRVLAQRDGLTGVANYRYLLERLQQEYARSQRSKTPFAYLMVDLDGLKAHNDRFGHRAGDAVLREVAQKLQASVRKIDLVGRYGGDEFGVLLVNTGSGEAVATAQRLLEVVASPSDSEEGRRSAITISVGVAAYPAHGETPDHLLKAADDALYQTKLAGKNGVTLASSPAGA